MLLIDALTIAKNIIKNLRINGRKLAKHNVKIVGSIRRKEANCNDIDILIITSIKSPQLDLLMPHQWIRKGNHLYSGYINSEHVDIFFCKRSDLAFAMMHHTGPASYNIRLRKYAKDRGWKLNQYGLWRGDKKYSVKHEKDITAILGTTYYKPTDRN